MHDPKVSPSEMMDRVDEVAAAMSSAEGEKSSVGGEVFEGVDAAGNSGLVVWLQPIDFQSSCIDASVRNILSTSMRCPARFSKITARPPLRSSRPRTRTRTRPRLRSRRRTRPIPTSSHTRIGGEEHTALGRGHAV